ncbi:MAG: SelL-related redox protein [Planctomycetaceae bacterium]
MTSTTAPHPESHARADALAAPVWMSWWLVAAGIYNLAWGALTVLVPRWLFDLTGMEPPSYPFIWQCVGMIVGVYGIGYLAAARDPFRHWPIVLVGFLGKIFGPLGYVGGVLKGEVPPAFGVTLPTNDLIWWIPFGLILYHAFRANTDTARGTTAPDLATALREARTQDGESLAELSRAHPLLIVLLRHSGCVFCREAIADAARALPQIEAAGARLVLVHQGVDDGSLRDLATRYGIGQVARVSDPEKHLYRSLELSRGTLGQLFGPPVWWRGFEALVRGHGLGPLVGDGFQMPGAFLIKDGRIVAAYRHAHAADRPDYAGLACGVSRPAASPSAT